MSDIALIFPGMMEHDMGLLAAILLALDIYAIWCVLQEPAALSSGLRKVFWIAAILLFPFGGMLIYFAFFRIKPVSF